MTLLSTILKSLGLVTPISKPEVTKFAIELDYYEGYVQEPFIDYNECPDCFKSGRLEDNGDIVCPDCGRLISCLAYHTM